MAVCQPPRLFPDCIDRDGHGTFLAGTIAAVPGNNTGIGSAVPAAWNISLLPVQFFSPDVPPHAAYAAVAIVHAAFNLFTPGTAPGSSMRAGTWRRAMPAWRP